MTSSRRSKVYHLVDRLIQLILTLLVSMTNTEWAFSVMKLVKTRFHNKMNDDFLADNLVVYVKKKIDMNFTINMIMDKFY